MCGLKLKRSTRGRALDGVSLREHPKPHNRDVENESANPQSQGTAHTHPSLEDGQLQRTEFGAPVMRDKARVYIPRLLMVLVTKVTPFLTQTTRFRV